METEYNTKRYIFLIFLLLAVSVGGIFLAIKFLFGGFQPNEVHAECGEGPIAEVVQENILGEFLGEYPWWDDNYSYFQQITLKNNNNYSLPTKCWAQISFDHEYYVEDHKALPDGSDLKIVYYNKDGYKELPFTLEDSNSQETTIAFELAKTLPENDQDFSYFLYYGNPAIETNTSITSPPEKEQLFLQNCKISLGDEVQPQLLGKSNRRWLLKGVSDREDFQLTYTVEVDDSIDTNTPPTFKLLGTNKSGDLEKVARGEYEATIDTSKFKPGTYTIQSTLKNKDATYKSSKLPIFISYPLFVAFTIDWEGSNVDNKDLEELIAFSNRHNDLPTTHFFNPRIYVTSEVTQAQAEYLTQWIQVRKLNGDDIGMHLHMHYDMIQAAGVKVRTSPKWTNTLNNGHDVPSSAYTYEEYLKILAWAKEEFSAQGLGVPTSFRAGGWFANLDTLRAINDSGFTVDSSGRDFYIWGTNQLRGYWNLNATTHPYHPSKANQNSSTPSPNFSLWEFPNNGADSYFYPAEELIKRFDQNYKRKPLTEPQTITYLSHAQNFTEDTDVLDPAFDHTDQFLVELDQGPVLYITLEDAYTYWQNYSK